MVITAEKQHPFDRRNMNDDGKKAVMADMEMAMKATKDIEIGQDITPPLPPLSFSLYDSSLSSHCSSCSRSLLSASTTTTTFLRFCCTCSTTASLPLLSGEHHLLLLLSSNPSLFPYPDSSDLRAALRLLHVHRHRLSLSSRLLGLLTNCRKLLEDVDSEIFSRIRAGARAMAMARAMRDGTEFDCSGSCGLEQEEAALCLVVTNGVDINANADNPIGIGVYDWRFSWINHSCSPNSCYRFVDAFEQASDAADSMRIEPGVGEAHQMEEFRPPATCDLDEGKGNYGPRVVVRSIKAIRRGEEATITYIDLLQPTTLRRSELLLKFQFICGCRRCSSIPQPYVDYALQETFLTHCCKNELSSPISYRKENAIDRFSELFDSTITEYMEVGDPVSCSEKIEDLLYQGVYNQHLEESRGVSHIDIRLSPIHHLSLNAYTTLSSTYRIRASQHFEGKQFHSFDMSRISAAYSLLLAGATHHIFLYEPSCIASAATFWVNAGESLLSLARSSSWNMFTNCMLRDHCPIAYVNCPRCLLMDKFEFDFSSTQTRKREFDAMSREFLMCVSIITPKVWSFLARDCQYLKGIKDPIDFSWLGCLRTYCTWDLCSTQSLHQSFNLDSESVVKESLSKCDDGEPASEMRTSISELGVHCLLYGGYLSCTCYDHPQYRTDHIRKVLCS